MLTLITKLFRKSGRIRGDQSSDAGAQLAPGPAPHVPTVETAQLSLAAILERFPEELKPMIERIPGPEVSVALPVPTILKQLPSGSVKMSLASMHRQAPEGVFKRGAGEEKRMIELPLAEVLKRVRPELLQRRHDQRHHRLPDNSFNLFGDKSNPYALSPTEPVEEPITPPMGNGAGVSTNGRHSAPTPERGVWDGRLSPPAELGESVQSGSAKAAGAFAAGADVQHPPVLLPIVEIAANWPESIKSEVADMGGATLALPANEVASGLAKGRVTFPWGKLREWITPRPASATEADETTELQLPLRIIAPIFLKQSQQMERRKQVVPADEDIPALFHGSGEQRNGVATARQSGESSEIPASEGSAEVIANTVTPTVANATPEPQEHTSRSSEGQNVTANSASRPESVSELFGQPDKCNWSPREIVENLVKLREVTGAIVALQEGLVVANRLPEGMNGEVFAAFLPQMFARLSQYTGEMQLGEVGELLLQTSGAQCKIFRLGEVFFATLGRAGEALPLADLQLCAHELNK